MQVNNLTFLQILRINHVELFQIKDKRSHLITSGHLQVLYSELINFFVLKLNDQKFALDQSLQVTGTYSQKDKWNFYIWPAFDGFFMLKISNDVSSALLKNFETILENTTVFRKQSELAHQLGLYSSESKHEGIFEKSGSAIKEGLHRTADAFSKFMSPQTENDTHPNQLMIRSFAELMNVDSPDVPMVDITTNDVQNLKDEVKEVINHHQENVHWRSLRSEEKYLKPGEEFLHMDMKPGLFRQHSGAENIRTTQTAHAQDQQEFVGTENQRLPSYEVQETKETLMRAFRKASFNLNDSKKEEALMKPIVEDDTDFTTGLCSGPSCPTNIMGAQSTTGTLSTGQRSDVSREDLKFEKWGSNITNPSETSIRDESDLGRTPTLSNQGMPNTSQRSQPERRERGPLVANLIGTGLPAESLGQTNLG